MHIPSSLLHSRYNGVMLGLFFELLLDSRLTRAHSGMIARIADFLSDIQVELPVPKLVIGDKFLDFCDLI